MAKLILFDNKEKLFLNSSHEFLDITDISSFDLGNDLVNKFIKDSVQQKSFIDLSRLTFADDALVKSYQEVYTIILPQELSLDNLSDKHYSCSVKKFVLTTQPDKLEIVSKARQLAFWDYHHQFCGHCGAKTINVDHEYAKQCLSCGYIAYPRITPCVLAAVTKNDKILLGRAPHFPPGVYSLLAGFIEVGESCEQAVAREVKEESGVNITNVQYYGSQPWPFPHSLMLAYTADYHSGDIIVDKNELEDARWFTFEGLRSCPELLPAKGSLSRMLLDKLIAV